MIIPNISNLLNLAHSVIMPTGFDYYSFISRTPNAIGYDVNTFAAPVKQYGSVQPVQQNMYQQLGLDFNHAYFTFFVSRDVVEVTRDVSADYILWNGKKYKCLSKMDWYAGDGWVSVLCIEVTNA